MKTMNTAHAKGASEKLNYSRSDLDVKLAAAIQELKLENIVGQHLTVSAETPELEQAIRKKLMAAGARSVRCVQSEQVTTEEDE